MLPEEGWRDLTHLEASEQYSSHWQAEEQAQERAVGVMRRRLARLLRMMEMRRSEDTNERDAVSGEWQREEDTLATMHLSIRVRRPRLVPRTVALAPTRRGPMVYGQVWHTPARRPRTFSASPVTALSCSAFLRPLGWRLNQCVSIKNW